MQDARDLDHHAEIVENVWVQYEAVLPQVSLSLSLSCIQRQRHLSLLMFMFVASLRWWHMKTQACFSNGLSPYIHVSPEPVLATDRGPP